MSRADIKAGAAYVELWVKSNRFERGLRDARQRLNEFGSELQAIGVRAVAMGASILAPLGAAVSAASRFEEAFSKFQTVFADNSAAVKAWGDEFAKQVGRSQTQIVEFMGAAQSTFIPLGFDPTEAEAMSKQLTTLAVDLASFNNMEDSEAFDRLLSSVVGNTENLQAFGIVAQQAQIDAKALEMGFDPSKLSAYQKAMAIINITMEGTAAAQGDAIKTANSFANQQKRLLGLVTDTAVTIGTTFLPVLSKMASQLGDLAAPLGQLIKNNEGVTTALAAAAIAMVGAGVGAAVLGTLVKSSAAVFTVFGGAIKAAAVVTGVFSAVSTIADIAILATTAALGAATGSATGTTIAFAALAALQASYPAVAGLVTGALTLIGSGLTANLTLSGLGTIAAGALSAAWTAAAGVMASAWAVIAAPAVPFIAAATAIVVVIGAIAASAAYAAARGIDFAGAWDGIKSTLIGAIQVIKDVGGVLMQALSAGRYTDAANALWIGMRIAFFEGINAIVASIKFLLSEGWSFITRFFTEMLTKTQSIMKAIADAMMNPLSAGSAITSAISSLSNTTISLDFSVNADKARAELAALKTQLSDSVEGQVGGGLIDQLQKSGVLSPEQAKTLSQVVDSKKLGMDGDESSADLYERETDASKKLGMDGDESSADLYERETDALANEILALEEGADAAERMKFAKQGLNMEQILAIENLRKHRDAIQEEKDAIEEATEAEKARAKARQGKQDVARIGEIAKKGDQLLDNGVSPEEIKRREMAQIQTDAQSGRLSKDSIDQATEDAEQRRLARREKLEEEGRRLAESTMTPQEILNDKLKKISHLQDGKVITGTVAERAEDKARKEFATSQGGAKSVSGNRGPASTFVTSNIHSLVAAGRGGTNNMESLMRDLLREAKEKRKADNENARETRREIRDSGGISIV